MTSARDDRTEFSQTWLVCGSSTNMVSVWKFDPVSHPTRERPFTQRRWGWGDRRLFTRFGSSRFTRHFPTGRNVVGCYDGAAHALYIYICIHTPTERMRRFVGQPAGLLVNNICDALHVLFCARVRASWDTGEHERLAYICLGYVWWGLMYRNWNYMDLYVRLFHSIL